MRNFRKLFFLVVMMMLLSSCSNVSSCPNADIEWVDMVMMGDIIYQRYSDKPMIIEKGKEVGKVAYTMAEHACSNHQMKNGDAAFLKKDTPIYEIKGYPTALMVIANDKVYVADTNKQAKTVGELYPIHQLVKNIYIESTEDGRRIHTFSQSSKDKFLNAWSKLKLEDMQAFNEERKMQGERIFLEIELNNNVSFRQLYWADANTFHNGAKGNRIIKGIIRHELSIVRE